MNKKKQQSAATCDRVLSVAGELFMRNGYESTSLQQIAAHCGVTKGALYHHFDSKDAILEAMCARHYAGQREKFYPILENAGWSAREKFKNLSGALRKYEGERPTFFKTYLRMHASSETSAIMLKGRLKRHRKEMYLDFVAPILEAGLKEDFFHFDGSPAMMALYLLQIEDVITEEMAALLISDKEGREAALYAHMEGMAFAFSRLLGVERGVMRDILEFGEGVGHYCRTLG